MLQQVTIFDGTDEMGIIYERIAGLECKEVIDGYVIYDDSRDLVHFLNPTAATVLELCDGKNDPLTIAAIMQAAYSLPQPPESDVEGCLEDLLSKGLVTPSGASSVP